MFKLCLIIVFISNICCASIAQVPDAVEIRNNKIKKIVSRIYTRGENDTLWTTYYFNQNGDDTAYYENGLRKYYNVIGYNKKLQPLVITKYFPSGSVMDSTRFVYHTDGSFVSVNTDAQFGMKSTETYDKKGNKLSLSIPDGTVIKYVYNSSGQLTSSFSIPVKGDKKRMTTYSYNSKGKLIGSADSGEYNSKVTYSYDSNGLLKKEIITSASDLGEKKISVVDYEYGY